MKIAILISALYKPSHFPSHTMLKALNREIFRTRLARYPQPVQRDIPVEAEISPVNEASMENKKGPSSFLPTIVGFHMTSLKFKLKNYRSYQDFTFTMH